jgi:hypothetical protein
MGERTLAIGSSRTEMPRNELVANTGALAWGADSYSSRIPDVLLEYQRALPQLETLNIADLIAQSQSKSGEDWAKILKLTTHQPVFKLPELDMPEPYDYETRTAMTPALAAMLTQEQPAANCCPCLPCNLL